MTESKEEEMDYTKRASSQENVAAEPESRARWLLGEAPAPARRPDLDSWAAPTCLLLSEC